MAARKRLVRQRLENVGWWVLDDYPAVIREMIRGRAGIYALYRGEKLYYVGLAVDLMRRLKQHLNDRHSHSWNRFSVYLMQADERIKEVGPEGNRAGRRFLGSRNLRKDLSDRPREVDDEQRKLLMGGPVSRRGRKKKAAARKRTPRASKAAPERRLAGFVKNRNRLRAYVDGYEYYGVLHANGRVFVGGQGYDTPGAAARAACGKRRNGMAWWKIRDANGNWVPVGSLRQ